MKTIVQAGRRWRLDRFRPPGARVTSWPIVDVTTAYDPWRWDRSTAVVHGPLPAGGAALPAAAARLPNLHRTVTRRDSGHQTGAFMILRCADPSCSRCRWLPSSPAAHPTLPRPPTRVPASWPAPARRAPHTAWRRGGRRRSPTRSTPTTATRRRRPALRPGPVVGARDEDVHRAGDAATARRERADRGQVGLLPGVHDRRVTLDGAAVTATIADNDLTVPGTSKDAFATLVVRYHGTPTTVPMPSHRSDTEPLGLTVTKDGWLWTMQEPYGASTWYPVNDQPSDKALYDIAITVPEGWSAVATGTADGQERQHVPVHVHRPGRDLPDHAGGRQVPEGDREPGRTASRSPTGSARAPTTSCT